MIRILVVLIGLNSVALVAFVTWYLAQAAGKNTDTMERGWMIILIGAALLTILLAAVPLYFSKSVFTLIFSGCFAVLPLLIITGIWLSNIVPSVKSRPTMAELYYTDHTQRSIATAIEQHNIPLLTQLIAGQDLNIAGNRVWGWDGLNYLQFAIRLRSNADSATFDEAANDTAIRLLVAHGAATTPALPEAVRYLSPALVTVLLDAGADPNVHGFTSSNPLLFELITTNSRDHDVAILLIARGADVNAKGTGADGMTPVMFAANNAGTSAYWNNTWNLVRYLLEDAHCDYQYTTPGGLNLAGIIRTIRKTAREQQITMCPDFDSTVAWLSRHRVNTDPD